MYRKSVCIVKKHRFYLERLKYYIETRFSIKKNSIRYRKSVCIVKKHRFTMKDSNFTSKMRLSIEENSIMYRKSVCIVKKHRFYNERLKFYIENEVLYSILCNNKPFV